MKKSSKTWHFTVDRTGDIYQHVALNRVAGHAGVASLTVGGKTTTFVSEQTIGIELANLGALIKSEKKKGKETWNIWIPPKDGNPAKIGPELPSKPKFKPVEAEVTVGDKTMMAWWEPFPDAQIASLKRLLAAFSGAGFGDALNNIVGHETVARPPGRKIDPGPAFPWDQLR